ncbi:polyketide synthase [Janthinobacterium sp. HH01]|uniref:AMP-binding protein n=1 Tax=Janthinobacterium sp. HH01 TaxID=1198452 RepID=UPI0002AEDF6E|nr:AMP-binding protein [Janthinobacterium sp. HH01]ELX11417.1 polyketide synthase [Janthinobacterium sp. HH01]
MSANIFEQTDPAALATLVLQALRRYGERPALNRQSGGALAGQVAALAQALRQHEVRPHELVTLADADPVQTVAGVLAAWLAGATPCVGPAAPDQRLWLEHGALRHSRAAPACLDAALVVEQALVGAVAHPLATLGRLAWPAPAPALAIVADWRADAWLPLVLQALLDDVAAITLLAAGQPLTAAPHWLAAPRHWLGAQDDAASATAAAGLLTWGGGDPPARRAAGQHLHGHGDHFILGLLEPGQQRVRVLGRHRVCNAAGRVLPDHAWGVLALAGTLPVVADTRAALAAPSERSWITELRARRRADGGTEFADAAPAPLRHAGRRLSAPLVRQLLADCGLGDAALAALDQDTPRRRLVLYTSDERGAQRLAAALPAWAAPLGVALLPRLPRDAAGAIDVAALRATAPPDSWLLAQAAQALGAPQGAPLQLRTQAQAVTRAPLPLPSAFVLEGGHYHGDAPALLVGPPLAAPDGDLTDRLRAAAAGGQGLVLVDGHGGERTLSYAALLDAAARIAAFLRAQGVAPGQEVIVHCPQPADLFAGVWGCILLGVLPVPLTPASPYDAPSNPLWHLLGPHTMLTGRTLLVSAAQQQATAAALARQGLQATLHPIEAAAACAPLPAAAWTPARGALMLLTSGSTGAPKGVVLTHDGLLSLSRAVGGAFGFVPGETSLNWLAIDHVGGLVQHHMRDLCLGHRQLHVDTAYVLADPTRMLDLIERHRVSLLWMANFGFNLVNEHAERIAAGRWNLASVKLWENGGEAVTHDSCQRFLALLAPHGLAGDVIKPVFGMTETHSACIGAHNLRRGQQDHVHWLSDTALDQPVRRALPGDGSPFVEVGQPFPGTSVRVVDAQGRLCRAGSAGRIEVSGLQLMAGYYRNEQANAEAFTADGWLRMGDCGFVVDGSLVVTGREKDIVIVNGLNYSAQALENSVEGVAGVRAGCCAAVAVRRPDDVTDSLVLFYSALDAGAGPDPAALEAALIAEHGLRPAALVALAADAWPRTAIGKIRRQRLASGFVAGEFADQIVLQGQGQLGERVVVPDWHFTLDWVAAAAPPAAARRVLWLGDAAPAGAALSALPGAPFGGFDGAGRASYRPCVAAELSAVLAAADELLDGLDMVVEAHALAPPQDDDAAVAGVALAAAHGHWEALFAAAELLPQAPALVLATSAALAVDGSEAGVAHAALPGVAASLAQSRPQLRVALVDGVGADAAALLRERPGAGISQVAYRGGARLTPMLRPLPAAQTPPAVPLQPRHILRPGGRYLVIGGLGGVGVHLCLHLLRNFGARLLVVGRGRLEQNPPRAQALAYLAEQAALVDGAGIDYRQADPADADALPRALRAAAQDWGAPPDAVFNLAGEGSVAERLAALSAEADGGAGAALRRAAERIALLHAVERALAGGSVPVVTFSSVNGWFGGTGFVEYAGACAYQAAYAGWQARRGARVHLCLDWSMWKQVGMAAEVPAALVALARRRGFDSLSPAQALASLHLALEHGAPRQLIGLYPSAPAVLQLLPPSLVRHRVEAAGAVAAAQVAAALGVAPELVRCSHAPRPAAALPAAHAAALLAVFRDVLVRPELDLDDNFFASGGDSIRAIQAVSRAADRGLTFSPLDLFEHKTVAALLGHLAQRQGLDEVAPDEAVDDGRPAALPPILGWWLEQADRPELRDHFTMGMRYEIDAGLAPQQVRDALLALIARHDALRLRLVDDDGAWRLATAADAAASLRFAAHRLAQDEADGAARAAAVEHGLHRSLDLAAGVLVSAAHLARGPARPALLLLVIHHAAVDGVSWRLLEDELRLLLDAQRRPGATVPAAAAAGFADWSRRLAQRARRVDGAALADAWAARLAAPSGVLPVAPGLRLLEAETAIASRVVPVEALRLLGDASVYEVLLTAVGWSLAAWMDSQALVLDVEGHGRLNRIMPADLGRVVGWFTAIAPLRLDFAGCASPADALPQVRAAADALRGNDLEWGMLRHMDLCPPGHPLRDLPPRQISFNYLGSFDSTPQPDALLAALPGSLSAEQSPAARRRYVIDIAAQVSNWQLELSVKYSPQVHGPALIERWLDSYDSVLRQLLSSSAHPTISAGDLLLALGEVDFDVEGA